jgi:hypothetical protein
MGLAVTAPLQLIAEELWTDPHVLTPESRWRFGFGWTWAQGPTLLYIGVNPSWGTADKPDATMIKWRGIAVHNGFGSYTAGNPFAYRASDPKELTKDLAAEAAVGGWMNEEALAGMIERADVIVPCWGVVPKPLWRIVSKLELQLEASGKVLMTLGRTKEGFPRHPLYLAYRTKLEPWA